MRGPGVVFVLVALAGSAAAQNAAGDKKQKSVQLFEEGRTLMVEKNDPEGACKKFNEAILLDPDAAGTMLNLGLCNERLGKFKTALYWFRKAQVRSTETNNPVNEKAAREHTTDLAAKVASVQVAFTGTPPEGAKVKIDGEVVPPDDYQHVEVDPGHHVLDAGAPHHKVVHQEFDVEGKGGQALTVTLVAGEDVEIIDRGRGRKRLALYSAIGGGALLAASATVSLYARSQYLKYADNGVPKNNDPATITKANDARHLAATWGTGLFIGGAVVVGVATALYFTAPAKERVDRTVFVPSLGPDQIGFAASGTF